MVADYLVDFVDFYMGEVPTILKTYGKLSPEKRMEKWLLRKAFEPLDLLPPEVLWRRKEAFSDGCSSVEKSWHEIIQERVESELSDEDFKKMASCYSPRPISCLLYTSAAAA